jgi:hypothetical protein
MSEWRIVPCENCGTEGRLTWQTGGMDDYGNPLEDSAPCPCCDETGGEIIAVQPIEIEDLDEIGGDVLSEQRLIDTASESYAKGLADGRFDAERDEDLRASAHSEWGGYGDGYAAGWASWLADTLHKKPPAPSVRHDQPRESNHAHRDIAFRQHSDGHSLLRRVR